jgi:hypothetical protein
MKPSVPKCLNRVGLLLRQIQAEQWPTRLGDWREVLARCEVLSKTAPKEARVRHWKGDSLRSFMYRSGLISYDLDSGLWYCPIFSPLQDYPDGWKSDALLERVKRQSDRESLGVEVAPKKKPSRLKTKAVKRSGFLGRPESM